MNSILEKIRDSHLQNFGQLPQVLRSPGRINIIGEHTDYNEGLVLPAAIDRYVYVGISKRTDKLVKLYSLNFEERAESTVDSLTMGQAQWANYVLGVTQLLTAQHVTAQLPHGFEITLYGDVPIGAGMSSSAALASAVGYALNDLFQLGHNRMQLAQIGQQCEHQFIGVKCGIMDQFASLHGQVDQVIRLDCRDLSYAYFPLVLGDYAFVLLNTNVSHSLASSAYNERRAQCEAALVQLQQFFPQVQSLRDASLEMLDTAFADKQDASYIKARFVISEIQRVLDVCEALDQGDLPQVGALMYETHQGLSADYEVSCAELDYLVDYVKAFPEVLGARMMGGGFGGCTINLVKKSFVETLISQVSPAYQEQFGIALDYYPVRLGQGTEFITAT